MQDIYHIKNNGTLSVLEGYRHSLFNKRSPIVVNWIRNQGNNNRNKNNTGIKLYNGEICYQPC